MDWMSAEKVALIPQCVECGAVWLPGDGERWQARLTDDEPPELGPSKTASARGNRLVTQDRPRFNPTNLCSARPPEEENGPDGPWTGARQVWEP